PSTVLPACSYCMNAPAMQFQRHGWDNHAVWFGTGDGSVTEVRFHSLASWLPTSCGCGGVARVADVAGFGGRGGGRGLAAGGAWMGAGGGSGRGGGTGGAGGGGGGGGAGPGGGGGRRRRGRRGWWPGRGRRTGPSPDPSGRSP